MLSCSSMPLVSCSHLLDHSDLFHKQAGAISGETSSRPGNGKVLTGTAPGDDVHRGQLRAIQLRYITDMDHVGKMQFRYFDGKGFDLAGPHRTDAVADCSQGKAPDAVEEAAHCQFMLFLIRSAPPGIFPFRLSGSP